MRRRNYRFLTFLLDDWSPGISHSYNTIKYIAY